MSGLKGESESKPGFLVERFCVKFTADGENIVWPDLMLEKGSEFATVVELGLH